MNIVITGASSGIGQELKKRFANAGHTVVSLSRKQEISDTSHPCDVGDEESVKTAFEHIKKTYGQIDILINNAGYGVCGVTELLESEEVENNFKVNFFGVYNCMKYALPLMHKSSKIFNINSACSLFPLPYRSIYCASKSASHMLSLCMRMELSNYGIEVVSICPGDIKTNFSKNRVVFKQTNERANSLDKTLKNIESRENKRLSLEYAGKKIFKICTKTKTKPLYIIGAKYKMYYLFSKLAPTSWFNRVLTKIFS